MTVQPKKHAIGSLSVTPLIDVVFLLLIFFLVSTRFAEEERSIEIELPAASQSLPLTSQPREMFINIDKQGQFFVDGKFQHPEQVETILRQAVANNPLTQTVVIRADKSTDWQFVLTAFDLCKKVGIQNYTAMTDDP